jgi:hypothetical protein
MAMTKVIDWLMQVEKETYTAPFRDSATDEEEEITILRPEKVWHARQPFSAPISMPRLSVAAMNRGERGCCP